MILTLAAVGAGFSCFGFFICAIMTQGRVTEVEDALFSARLKLFAIRDLANKPRTIRKADIRAILGSGE